MDADSTTPSSLLNFVSSATNSLKFALDKPVKPKRKVNHRKYLQRQMKGRASSHRACGGVWVSPGQFFTRVLKPTELKEHGRARAEGNALVKFHMESQDESFRDFHKTPQKMAQKISAVEEIQPLKTTSGCIETEAEYNTHQFAPPPPLRKRKLPESFWNEPAKATRHTQAFARQTNLTYGVNELEILDWLGPELDDLIERWSEESDCASNNSSRTGSLSDASTPDPYSPYSEGSENCASMEEFFEERVPFLFDTARKDDGVNINNSSGRICVSNVENTMHCNTQQPYNQRQLTQAAAYFNGHYSFPSTWGATQNPIDVSYSVLS